MGKFANTLFSLKGRLRRGQFWLAFIIVFVGGAYSGQDQSAAGLIVGILSLYVALCVYGKRLHDFGQSAWYMIVPIGATFGSYFLMISMVSQVSSYGSARRVAEEIFVVQLMLLGLWLIVTLVVGIYPSQKGDNRFGMDSHATQSVPTAPPDSSN